MATLLRTSRHLTTTSRLPLGRAHMLAATAIREARRAGLPTDSISPTGSLRRYAPDIGDVSLVVTASLPFHEEVLTGFGHLPSSIGVLARTPASVTVATTRGTV